MNIAIIVVINILFWGGLVSFFVVRGIQEHKQNKVDRNNDVKKNQQVLDGIDSIKTGMGIVEINQILKGFGILKQTEGENGYVNIIYKEPDEMYNW